MLEYGIFSRFDVVHRKIHLIKSTKTLKMPEKHNVVFYAVFSVNIVADPL